MMSKDDYDLCGRLMDDIHRLNEANRELGNTIWKLQNRLSKAGRKLKAAQESNRQLKEEFAAYSSVIKNLGEAFQKLGLNILTGEELSDEVKTAFGLTEEDRASLMDFLKSEMEKDE